MAQLLRVDKNGTKYWMSTECPKCGGNGTIWYYSHVSAGQCFLCGGTGYHETKWKEYTPEYAKKLADRRLAKARKKAPETNAKFLEQMGMSADGKAYIILGDTFAMKDELKNAGAKFNRLLGWHFDHDDNGYDCFELSIDQIAEKDENTYVWELFEDWHILQTIKELKDAHAPKTDSEYVGEVGKKVELNAEYVKCYMFETHYTYSGELNFIYKFVTNGNTLTWKTGKNLDLEEGATYSIKGTIKEHKEYKGDKQTVLTRCKITQC